jgi:hypothetical protein
MNTKSLGTGPERSTSIIRNAETSTTIGIGRPVCFNANGTRTAYDVVLPGTAGAALATTFFTGIASEDILPGEIGPAVVAGFCPYALITRQVRAASTDSFASAASIAVGGILQIDTAGNAMSLSSASLGASAYSPMAAVIESLASLASSASATSLTALRIESVARIWLRLV